MKSDSIDSSVLKNVHIFSELNKSELDKIFSFSRLRTFDKGEMIFFDTEPYNGFYIVVKGSVKIFKISKEGRETALYFIYPYNTFAEVPLFEQFDKVSKDEFFYPANAMALENETKVVQVRSSVVKELLEKNAVICLKMLASLAKRLRIMNTHIENLSEEVTKRLARFILTEFSSSEDKSTGSLELKITKHDLASFLGTVDETLSRAFKKLQEEKVISVSGKLISIKNLLLLRKAAQG